MEGVVVERGPDYSVVTIDLGVPRNEAVLSVSGRVIATLVCDGDLYVSVGRRLNPGLNMKFVRLLDFGSVFQRLFLTNKAQYGSAVLIVGMNIRSVRRRVGRSVSHPKVKVVPVSTGSTEVVFDKPISSFMVDNNSNVNIYYSPDNSSWKTIPPGSSFHASGIARDACFRRFFLKADSNVSAEIVYQEYIY